VEVEIFQEWLTKDVSGPSLAPAATLANEHEHSHEHGHTHSHEHAHGDAPEPHQHSGRSETEQTAVRRELAAALLVEEQRIAEALLSLCYGKAVLTRAE
jgi:hypothetical protein